MAFSSPSDTPLPPDYTNSSQGPRASANDAIGSLFDNINRTADLGIKEADRQERKNITDDILSQADQIQNEFGVGDATDTQQDAESSAPSARPASLDKAYDNLDRLQSAYVDGSLKESHYWARLNVMVRQLRAKYPGYRDQIDDMVAGVVGAKPANALRSSLFQEWNDAASASKSAGDKLLQFAMSHVGDLPPDYEARMNGPDAYTLAETMQYVGGKEKTRADVTDRRNQLALQVDQQNVDKTAMEGSFRIDATQLVSTTLSDASKTLGKTWQQANATLQTLQQQIANGGKPDPAQIQQLGGQLQQIRLGLNQALQQQFTTSWDGDPQHSYIANMDKNTSDAIIAQAMAPIDNMLSSFNDPNGNPYAIVQATLASVEAMKNSNAASVLQNSPTLGLIGSINQVAGPQVAGLALQIMKTPGGTSLLDAVASDLSTNSGLSAVLGQGTVTNALDNGEKLNQKSDYYNSLMNNWTQLSQHINTGDLPPEVVSNAVKYMFSDQYGQMAKLDYDAKYAWYSKMASPQVTAQMLQLKQSGDVASWNIYQNWVKTNFSQLYAGALQSVENNNQFYANPSALGGSLGSKVTWDKDTSSFNVDFLPTQIQAPTGNALTDAARTLISIPGLVNIHNDVAKLNAAIQVFKPIVEANGGNIEDVLGGLMEQMGVSPGTAGLGSAMIKELENNSDSAQKEKASK